MIILGTVLRRGKAQVSGKRGHDVQIAIGNSMMAPAGSWEERCRLAREAGFDGVEMWIGSAGFDMETTDQEVEALARGAHAAGLIVSSVASSLGWRTPLCSPDGATFGRAVAIARRQIECARLFGTDAILVVTGPADRSIYQIDGLKRVVAALQELAKTAERHGVRIGVETCPRLAKNLMTPYECASFLENVGSEAVGIYLDTANVMYSGFPEHFVRALGPRLVRIHFKDTKETEKGPRATYPGDGTLEFGPVMDECRAAGYDSWAILEYGPPPGEQHSFELMQKAARATRQVVGRQGA